MQRRIVDLPEPDGPTMQTTSPVLTVVEKPRMTWFAPKLLWTSTSSIIAIDFCAEALLEPRDEEDQRQAHAQVERGDEREDGRVLEGRGGDELALQRELGDRDGRGLRGVLQHHDHDVAVGRQHDLERLRQDHPAHGQPPAHADRLRGLDLALVDRLDAGAEVLGLIGRIGDAEADDRGLKRGERDAEIRQHEIDVEQLHDDRDAADHVDDRSWRSRRAAARRRRASAPRQGRAPSTARASPTVTMTVSRRPCIRIGRNSADCLRKAVHRTRLLTRERRRAIAMQVRAGGELEGAANA